MTYPNKLPASIPEGQVLVHSHVRPSRTQGQRGARYWLQSPSDRLEERDCDWAPELGRHYRVALGARPYRP